MSGYRLPGGGRIDRARPLGFRFDGRALQGLAGDTLASALMANGISLVGRSFKYHRPRGIVTAGAAEPNALVTLGDGGRRTPNTRATMVPLTEALEARSQNAWPSRSFDIGAVNGLLGPLLGAGFYYKTFMWPASFWERIYEPAIRRAAGLGRAGHAPDPDSYEKSWAHCDLLVIGAGPAGLSAALTAARAGARVILADEGTEPGGALLSEPAEPGPGAAAAMLAELAALGATVMPMTTVFGWYDSGVFGALEQVTPPGATPHPDQPAERLWRIAAKRAVLASGAEERPLVFGGNDRPGVMLAGAIRSYATRWGVAAGRRVALFTNGPSGYETARTLEALGVDVAAVIDPRPDPEEARGLRARVIAGAMVTGTSGRRALSGLTLRHADGGTERLACDALGMSGGWSPVVHLACQRGDRPHWSDTHAAFLPPAPRDGLAPAGAAAGLTGIATAMADGAARAVELLAEIGIAAAAPPPGGLEPQHPAPAPLWSVPDTRGKAFVDFQNDVHLADLALAEREGYGHVEHAKRYTTAGMATDQGKLGNVNAIGILAGLRGTTPGAVGTTTYRPFYTPVSFGALAGSSTGPQFQPLRRSPLHGWAERHGARFVETGHWLRSAWFPRPGEAHWRESVDREARAVRSAAGICDVSFLGKIEISGPDAAEFLNRVYSNAFLKLPVGKARYGLMLREDGFIYDDGTTSRLSETRYFMTTTTAHAAGVMAHLEFCAQVLWPGLDLRMASVSDQWAQMAIAGPKARDILAGLVEADLSNDAFPFLAAREVMLKGGIPARLFRISFSGELAYELAVPAGYGDAVAEALMVLGAPHGLTPYGSEALAVLRIEKGHVTHAEINGTVTPGDLGMGRMVSAVKPDFIGRRMGQRPGLHAPDRLRLVGIRPVDPAAGFRTGAHVLCPGDTPSMEADQGHVTSSCFSPHLGHRIGLALVTRGPERIGEEVVVWDGLAGEETRAILCDPVFVDPEGSRLHA